MNIDVLSESFKAQFDDAADFIKSFSQSNHLTVDTAICIIMAAARREGGVEAIIAMDKASTAMAMDYGNTNVKSRQQRRWEARQSPNLKSVKILRESYPDIFTFEPIQVVDPED